MEEQRLQHQRELQQQLVLYEQQQLSVIPSTTTSSSNDKLDGTDEQLPLLPVDVGLPNADDQDNSAVTAENVTDSRFDPYLFQNRTISSASVAQKSLIQGQPSNCNLPRPELSKTTAVAHVPLQSALAASTAAHSIQPKRSRDESFSDAISRGPSRAGSTKRITQFASAGGGCPTCEEEAYGLMVKHPQL